MLPLGLFEIRARGVKHEIVLGNEVSELVVREPEEAHVVDAVAQGDKINSVKIEGDAAAVLAAKADRVAEWNRYLSA